MKTLLLVFSLLFFNGVFSQRNEKEAKQLADSLYKVLKKNPDLFCALIEQFSEDPASKEKCGFYDFEKGDSFVSPIAQVVRKKKNSTKIQAPVRTIRGYFIIQPLGVREDEIRFKTLVIQVQE
jgi:parvulin-like peptidyl-prolyl isomerase